MRHAERYDLLASPLFYQCDVRYRLEQWKGCVECWNEIASVRQPDGKHSANGP